MKMSDKELDKLFSSQLADMEIEPSAAVWNNIKRDLGGEEERESKKSIIPMLQIAAGIIVFVSVALLFRPQTEKVALTGDYTAAVTSNPSPYTITPQPTEMLQDVQIQDATPKAGSVAAVSRHKNNTVEPQAKFASNTNTTDTTAQVMAYVRDEPVNTDARSSAQPQILTQPVASQVNLQNTDHVKPVKTLVAVNPPVLKDNAIAKKKKIRSLGDLFNVMIAKVDKRPNKIIQFKNNDDEEGDFTVDGVNLGPIQIKKNE